ncbi:MAG: hypothetical protein KatS3mg030_134 [Saprospiraceae bacterium]|nr:MAG: hypothetical protein KatS3mg030_134 [Saprospiraceae bacterium]
MNESTKTRLDAIIDEGYEFRFGDYIGQGFNIAQKNVGGFVLFALVFFLIVIIVNFIPVIGSLANQFFLGPCLTAGAYLVANQVRKGRESQFGDFFKGFNFAGQLALTAVFMTIIIMIAMLPFIFFGGGKELFQWYMELIQNPAMAEEGLSVPWEPSVISFLLLLPVIYFAVAYQWAYLFVIFYGFNFWDALEYSRRMITRKWFVFFAFLIVISIIAAAGLILLCIGILFTLPAMWCMNLSAFADVTQLDAEGVETTIEEHLL